jgi:hypothetical protein
MISIHFHIFGSWHHQSVRKNLGIQHPRGVAENQSWIIIHCQNHGQFLNRHLWTGLIFQESNYSTLIFCNTSGVLKLIRFMRTIIGCTDRPQPLMQLSWDVLAERKRLCLAKARTGHLGFQYNLSWLNKVPKWSKMMMAGSIWPVLLAQTCWRKSTLSLLECMVGSFLRFVYIYSIFFRQS